MTSRVVSTALRLLADRGFVVSRHPAERRQRLLAEAGIDLVVDVGAARGDYGTELRHFGYTGSIVSFEPLAAPFGQLSASARADGRWTAHNCALGAEEGSATIHIASNSDSSSLLPPHRGHTDAAPQVTFDEQQVVPVKRLDDVVAADLDRARATFLKVDAQGFERQVLAGGPDTLAASVGVQLELSFTPLYEGGILVDEIISTFYRDGFTLVSMIPGFVDPGGAMLQADGIFWRDAAR
ncbi:FkbM family methyltransferase [Nocardioides sp.]|uniref:FkbM family methyltransferase n=1 Tax=Nocardioides sp. TaxID=35761 RepID=UPI003514772C